VKCKNPIFAGKIRIFTTQNTYLSISGFEAYTGAPPARGSMRMGGRRGRGKAFSLSFSMGSAKVTLD
jgi:hypothetical protein